jgi:copper(I)-binding protein
MRRALPAFVLAALAAPVAASAAIVIHHPQVRPTLGAQGTSAAYLAIENTGPRPDKLVAVSCACAKSVMPHRTITEHGISRMEMEMGVVIPPHSTVTFDPRSRHLMLTGITRRIAAGDKAPMVLRFEKAGPIRVVFTASDLAGMDVEDHRHSH